MTLFKSPNTIFGRHYYSFYISEETGHEIASLKPGRAVHTYNPSTWEMALRGSGVKIILGYIENRGPAWDTEEPTSEQKQKLGVVVYALSQHLEVELGASLHLRPA